MTLLNNPVLTTYRSTTSRSKGEKRRSTLPSSPRGDIRARLAAEVDEQLAETKQEAGACERTIAKCVPAMVAEGNAHVELEVQNMWI